MTSPHIYDSELIANNSTVHLAGTDVLPLVWQDLLRAGLPGFSRHIFAKFHCIHHHTYTGEGRQCHDIPRKKEEEYFWGKKTSILDFLPVF